MSHQTRHLPWKDSSPQLHKGACRWVDCIHILIADLAKDWELGDINNVDIQLDHVGEIRSNRSKCRLEIFKDLLCLSTELMQTDNLSLLVKSNLTSDKDGPPACYLNHLGIAWWRR